jgi:small subunit ribosomal protein S14
MAKESNIQRNLKRKKLVARYEVRRAALKKSIMDKSLNAGERFELVQQLAALPRNSAQNRVRNRCELTGRPRGYYRKLKMSRIALRELSSNGLIPGMTKSSW